MYKQRKIAVIVLIGIVLGLLSILVITRDKDGLNTALIVVPADAVLAFKGQNNTSYESKSKGSIQLPAGDYTISAKKDGFKDQSISVKIKENNQKVILLLEPESREAKEWAEKNQRKYLDAEKIAGEESQKAGEEFRNANPIISKLPYSQGFYRIDYGQESDNIVLYITADQPVGRVIAMSTIRQWGYEPADFDIRFYNFDNPFKEGDENE